MTLRQLEAFRATIQSGSITGAADRLHISQPSVSRLVADLERSVGFPLFRRAGRGLAATVEARRFYQAIESMFLGIERLSELAETIRTTAGGTVSLGVVPAFSHIVMPEAVGDLYRARPEVRIMVYTRNTPAIVDAVRLQQFDLGIVARAPPYEGVEILYETAVPYVCLLPESHPLPSGRGSLDLERIADTHTFITFGGAYPDAMLEMDPELSARLRKTSRLSAANMPVTASLVRASGALALVDCYSAQVATRLGGVTCRPLRQQLKYHIAIVTRGHDTLPLAAKELADLFIRRLESMAG